MPLVTFHWENRDVFACSPLVICCICCRKSRFVEVKPSELNGQFFYSHVKLQEGIAEGLQSVISNNNWRIVYCWPTIGTQPSIINGDQWGFWPSCAMALSEMDDDFPPSLGWWSKLPSMFFERLGTAEFLLKELCGGFLKWGLPPNDSF